MPSRPNASLEPKCGVAFTPVVGDEDVLNVGQRLAVEARARQRRGVPLFAGLGVRQVERAIFGEARMEGDFEQPALAHRHDLRHAADRLRVEDAVADDAKAPGLSR